VFCGNSEIGTSVNEEIIHQIRRTNVNVIYTDLRDKTSAETRTKEHKRLVAGCMSLRKHMIYFLEAIERVTSKENTDIEALAACFSNLTEVGKKIEKELEKADNTSEKSLKGEEQAYKELSKELFDILDKLNPGDIPVTGPATLESKDILTTLYDDLYVWLGY